MAQKRYNIRNFHNIEDFEKFFNPKTLEDMKKKFGWLRIETTNYPKNNQPQFAIKNKLFFNQEPKVKQIKEE